MSISTGSPRSVVRRLACLSVAGLLFGLAGCAGGATAGYREPPPKQVRTGGSLVIGSEQEPGCADWIGSCSGSIFGTYVMQVQTMPAVFQYRPVNGGWRPVATDLMAAEPSTTVVGGKQRIVYRFNPKAVWSDGVPIGSADLKYTALQVRDGEDILDKTGYSLIESVSTPDAETAVVTLKRPYVDWKALFSGFGNVLPEHLLAGRDRDKAMRDGYSWSGGPWKIAAWKRGSSVTLVPNDRYWGKRPKLDKVTFEFTANTSSQFLAFRSGQLDAIYPSPQLEAINEVEEGMPNARLALEARTTNVEALWLNNAAFPFDSLAVRKAFGHAVDRRALVTRLYGKLGVRKPVQTFWPGNNAEFGGDSFDRYRRDLAEVDRLMHADGWVKNDRGIWAKHGREARFTLVSLSGDTRRLLEQQIIQSQVRQAGFEMTIDNKTPSELFSNTAPKGAFQAGLWTLIATNPTDTFQSDRIPSKANGEAGLNFMRVRDARVDELLGKVDSTLDPVRRKEYSKQADAALADGAVSLPLDDVPSILLTNRKIGGPVSINPVEGPFWNLNEWGLTEG
ncbi:ABC transporter substrate-binding protein [Sciscionella sediminilitoris]|uniref:ABC transporter substrate-binding protein n=1 Tax=Sciscionella sediminilitoris TaxID=1445613 RepID=UPI001E554E9E|nr:ABC transporter substrate-binding protein [Sciscionella sp. SE31]